MTLLTESTNGNFPFKKVLGVLLAVVILGAVLWNMPTLVGFIQRASQTVGLPATTAPNATSPTLTPPNTPPPTLSQPAELVDYALELINTDRAANGLQDVSLSSVNSGQIHAEDMLANDYFSHWDLNGFKPYMRYSLAGGRGSVAENIAAYLGRLSLDPKTALKNLEWSMMYDDASSEWGHKYNILNPFHNKVSIGIAYAEDKGLYFVEDFENDYVEWSKLTVSNGEITMTGTLTKSGLTLEKVAIYFEAPVSLTTQQIANPPYSGSYGVGSYVGLALPPGMAAVGGITMTASTWSQNGKSFQISFSLSQAINSHGKGVYTLFLQSNLENTATEDYSLTSYSLWFSL